VGKQNQTNPSLRRFHALGKKVAELRDSTERVHGTLAKLKAKSAAAKNRRMEAHRFYKMYQSKKKLDEICSYGRSSGKPLTRNHVVHLLRVEDPKERCALAKKCADNSWSARRLNLEIRKGQPRRKYGGAKQKPPESDGEALLITEGMAANWLRWVSVLKSVKVESKKPRGSKGKKRKPARSKKRVGLNDLPPAVRTRLVAVRKEMEKLSASIERKLKG
jgi:hypothetical protein